MWADSPITISELGEGSGIVKRTSHVAFVIPFFIKSIRNCIIWLEKKRLEELENRRVDRGN